MCLNVALQTQRFFRMYSAVSAAHTHLISKSFYQPPFILNYKVSATERDRTCTAVDFIIIFIIIIIIIIIIMFLKV